MSRLAVNSGSGRRLRRPLGGGKCITSELQTECSRTQSGWVQPPPFHPATVTSSTPAPFGTLTPRLFCVHRRLISLLLSLGGIWAGTPSTPNFHLSQSPHVTGAVVVASPRPWAGHCSWGVFQSFVVGRGEGGNTKDQRPGFFPIFQPK